MGDGIEHVQSGCFIGAKRRKCHDLQNREVISDSWLMSRIISRKSEFQLCEQWFSLQGQREKDKKVCEWVINF